MSDEGPCGICGKPLLDGEAIFTLPDKDGNLRHYDCCTRSGMEMPGERAKKLRKEFDEASERLKGLLDGVRKKLGEIDR